MRIVVVLMIVLLNDVLYGQAPKCSVKETSFYLEVDELPRFSSEDYDDMYDYIYSNITYPQEADVSGKVIASFVVSKDGSVQDVKIEKPLYEECDGEVRRVLAAMPRWKAGKKDGKPVNTWLIVPVSFSLH